MPTAYDGTVQRWREPEQVDRGFGRRQLVIVTLVEARGSGGVCTLLPGGVEYLEVIAGGRRRLSPTWTKFPLVASQQLRGDLLEYVTRGDVV
jgi:hypothetical protein